MEDISLEERGMIQNLWILTNTISSNKYSQTAGFFGKVKNLSFVGQPMTDPKRERHQGSSSLRLPGIATFDLAVMRNAKKLDRVNDKFPRVKVNEESLELARHGWTKRGIYDL